MNYAIMHGSMIKVKNQCILVHSTAMSTKGAVLNVKMFMSEENRVKLSCGYILNCIKRQLIQSEQSRDECCFSWAFDNSKVRNIFWF